MSDEPDWMRQAKKDATWRERREIGKYPKRAKRLREETRRAAEGKRSGGCLTVLSPRLLQFS